MIAVVLGIDPGDCTGLLIASWRSGEPASADSLVYAVACQCPMAESAGLLARLLDAHEELAAGAIEGFDNRARASGLHGTSASRIRRQAYELAELARSRGIKVSERYPAQLKPWASGKRLRYSGLWDLTRGMKNARDAARPCLYAAVFDLGLTDPLSRKLTA